MQRCFELVKFTIDSECLRAVLFPDIYDGFRKPWFYEGTNISKKASVLGDMPNRCVVFVESYIPLHESLSPVSPPPPPQKKSTSEFGKGVKLFNQNFGRCCFERYIDFKKAL